MTAPPVITSEELSNLRGQAIAIFRVERMEEPLEDYLEAFEEYLGITEDLLEQTIDLQQLEANAMSIVTHPDSLKAFRYLAAPPISEADLKVVADVKSLAPGRLRNDATSVRALVETVLIGLDRGRFPWVQERRDPEPNERSAAVLATAALLATQRVGTRRRNASKTEQEARVEIALTDAGFTKVATREISSLARAPRAGEFCRESMVGDRKADFVIGLHDSRILALECKVSNSETNSIKRVKNDAAVKAEYWRDEFGPRNIVPAAMLGGVYKLLTLEQAQQRGLTLFWAHQLSEFVRWIESTRPGELRSGSKEKRRR